FTPVDCLEGPRPPFWFDVGGGEGRDTLRDARTLRDRLLEKGWTGAELAYLEESRGDHSERAWARRARGMLEFLFPPPPPPTPPGGGGGGKDPPQRIPSAAGGPGVTEGPVFVLRMRRCLST